MAEIITIDKVVPYENNQKKHPDSQLKALAEVVKEVGWRQNVEVNQKGVIVAGHGRFETWKKYAKQMSLPDVWITDDTGKTIFGKHDERPLTPAQEKMWRIADNKLNESSWKMDLVIQELQGMDEFYRSLTGFTLKETDEKYTKKIVPPVYEIKGDKPDVNDLYNEDVAKQMILRINELDVPEDIKDFLKAAAMRLVVFNYALIAEYYAHAPERLQKIMEDMALVIIDFEKAIALGYVELTENLLSQYETEQQV
jgi:hypothetical protein